MLSRRGLLFSLHATAQAVNWIGWVPLRLYDSSDVESLTSDERGEAEGEHLLEFRDPTNDEIVSPLSVSRRSFGVE